MKDSLFNIMTSMMPIMSPIFWIGVIAAIIGFLFILAKYIFKKNIPVGITWSTRIALTVSIFFIAAQIMGLMLGVEPSINFGDSSKFEFNMVSFWVIGVVLLVATLIVKFLGKSGDEV